MIGETNGAGKGVDQDRQTHASHPLDCVLCILPAAIRDGCPESCTATEGLESVPSADPGECECGVRFLVNPHPRFQ